MSDNDTGYMLGLDMADIKSRMKGMEETIERIEERIPLIGDNVLWKENIKNEIFIKLHDYVSSTLDKTMEEFSEQMIMHENAIKNLCIEKLMDYIVKKIKE